MNGPRASSPHSEIRIQEATRMAALLGLRASSPLSEIRIQGAARMAALLGPRASSPLSEIRIQEAARMAALLGPRATLPANPLGRTVARLERPRKDGLTMLKKGRFAFLFSLIIASVVVGQAAEKTKAELADEAEAAEEESKLIKEGRVSAEEYEFRQGGKLILSSDADPERPSVLGVFISRNRVYQVKVADEALRTKLVPFHGKVVTLAGKVRNGGKNLIVQEVLTQSGGFAPPTNSSPARM